MTLWTFLTAAVSGLLACGIFAILTDHARERAKLKLKVRDDNDQISQVLARLESLEDRLGNLESIVIERERHNEFDQALCGAGGREA